MHEPALNEALKSALSLRDFNFESATADAEPPKPAHAPGSIFGASVLSLAPQAFFTSNKTRPAPGESGEL
jgi:hypothetical protein